MNNIEILEEFMDKVDIYFDNDISKCAITSKIAGIIEFLIQENKELKENPPIIFKNAEIKIGDEHINKYIGKNYIPKSKVKEKIEELQDEFEYLGEDNKRVNKMTIENLQELLEE